MALKARLGGVWHAMTRTKHLEKDNMQTPLRRCLTTFDLTLLGIGNMAGSGIYVLTGTVIRDKAGPATFLSYLIAGVTALLNALCYAELGSRIPKAGSAYTYTYIAGGEFLAFLIGWSVILEYVLSVASVARGWSGTIDALVHKAISNGTIATIGRFPATDEWLAEYPDFIAVAIVVVFCVILLSGPKMSVNFNSIITTINIIIITIATVTMLATPYHSGQLYSSTMAHTGGLLPFNFAGVIAGAGTCFYAFIGFDAITVSCEEAKTPRFSLPLASAISVSFVTCLFVISSFALCVFVPWSTVDRVAPFINAFTSRNINWASYLVGVGAMLGISASLFTSLYALPRIVYSMAQDGLLPAFMGYLLNKTQVPAVALAIFGCLAAILAFLFDIHTLAEFLSIGTLMAYTLVCANLVVLRYRKPEFYTESDEDDDDKLKSVQTQEEKAEHDTWKENIGRLKVYYNNVPFLRNATPGRVPIIALVILVGLLSCFAALVLVGTEYLSHGAWWAVLVLIFLLISSILCIFVMLMHEQNKKFDTFKVPFVPIIPCFTIMLNLMLIVKLSPMTWIRFFIWTFIGLIIYFTYGVRNSHQGYSRDADNMSMPTQGHAGTEITQLLPGQMPLQENTEYPQPKRYDSTAPVDIPPQKKE